VCGTRGSAPAPGAEFVRYGGHTSCLAVAKADGPPNLLLDAGSGIRRVTPLLDGRPFDGSILLGHLHWDHTHGLPFFRGGDHPDSRVDVYLPEQGVEPRDLIERILSPPHFPITPAELQGDWRFLGLEEGIHQIDGFEVLAREIPHKGGRTFGYRISDGDTAVAYLSDHYPASLGPGADGFGPYHESAVSLAQGVDLLIHDAQYREEEWSTRAAFGHSTPQYALGLAKTAGATQVLLFHHDFARTDDELDDLGRTWAAAGSPVVHTAYEGQVIDVAGTGR
jgi:ribonuclease BN (tRNA processing enzyme)